MKMPQGDPGEKLRSKRLLCVEDEPEIRDIIQEALIPLGLEVKTCNNGLEAVQLLQDEEFDAILADIRMPKMSGMELLAGVRQRNITTPFLFLTGCIDSESMKDAIHLGAVEFITKPFDPKELRNHVYRAVEFGSAARAVREEIRKTHPEIASRLEYLDLFNHLIKTLDAPFGRR